MTTSAPIPLTIITGFLGAGKTTLLNHILHGDHGLRVAVLVNDFGDINIDSQLVVGIEGETVSLSNGCICCSIRGDLLDAAVTLLQRPEPPDYIIIETSGVSDPLEVALTFQPLQQILIDSILTIIDAEQILLVNESCEGLARQQIRMSDLLILNKIDLVDTAQRQLVHIYIRNLAPKARILETTHAVVPLPLLLNVGAFDLHRRESRSLQDIHVHDADEDIHHDHEAHVAHTDHTLVFNTWRWQSDQPLSYRAIRQVIDSLPETIYRAKGIFFLVDDPDQKWVLHLVGQRTSLKALSEGWGSEAVHSQIVLIGAAGSLNPDALQQQLEACIATEAPRTELELIANRAIEWLRKRLPRSS